MDLKPNQMNEVTLRYARKAVGGNFKGYYVKQVGILSEYAGSGRLNLHLSNDVCLTVSFASFSVMCHCLRNWRNLYGVELWINGQQSGKVSRKHSYLSKQLVYQGGGKWTIGQLYHATADPRSPHHV